MASGLMKSVSGIRGIVGETMTPDLVLKVGSAFARYCKKGTVVVGRDSRITGGAIAGMIESVLMMSGCNVVRIGIVPTPTVQIMVEELGADGGVVISASHNPIEWNAFKLINKTGTFLNAAEMKRFFALMDADHAFEKWDKVGCLTENDSAENVHIEKVLSVINFAKIKKKRFRVALDSVNGAGSLITGKLLRDLGCEVIPVYCDITGTFPRTAEPLAENLGELSRRVITSGADIGFAQDPDADRLAIVDEKGRPIGEENTLSLVVEHLLSRQSGRVVINLSTTKAVEDIAAKYGSGVARTRVGEINVVDEMRKRGARIGGEGNGGIISPEVHLGRDSLVGIGYVLEMMAERNKTISELASDLPPYSMKKGKVKTGNRNVEAVLEKIVKEFRGDAISRIDGLRIDFKTAEPFRGGWVHLRSSNTEPIFRIISEGRDARQASAIYNYFAGLFK